MARFHDKTRSEEGMQLSLTPMIDVIFQLLIFFMIGMKFKVPEAKIDTYLPADAPPQQQEILPEEYKIRILARGSQGATFYIGAVQYPNVDALAAALQEVSRRPSPKKNIIIDADPAVAFENVMSVLNQCVRFRLTEISFARPAS